MELRVIEDHRFDAVKLDILLTSADIATLLEAGNLSFIQAGMGGPDKFLRAFQVNIKEA